MYQNTVPQRKDILAHIKEGQIEEGMSRNPFGGRLLLKGGRVIDPRNHRDEIIDIAICGDRIYQIENEIIPEKGDCVVDCDDLMVIPGIIDMHLHLGDLFEVSTEPIACAAQDGVTSGLSPGAGNTFMAPALLGAEVDRGLPINLGIFLGAPAVLGTRLTTEELILMFQGKLSTEIMSEKLTRNSITNTTAALTIGIKDHMGHYIMPDESIDKIFEITSRAGLLYMSHTQDPEHSERMVRLAKGRPLHLGHVTAAGCGSHGDPVESLQRVLNLINGEQITGEFVTTMLRPSGGSLEGLRMTTESKKLALDALHEGKVKILVSDGQNQATMKGFGDTRDNIPVILELAEEGVLTLSDAVATMTSNPATLIAKETKNMWWKDKVGHLGVGALANVTIINARNHRPVYTIVNGRITAFEKRLVRRGLGAGGWLCKFGMVRKTGVGDLSMYSVQK